MSDLQDQVARLRVELSDVQGKLLELRFDMDQLAAGDTPLRYLMAQRRAHNLARLQVLEARLLERGRLSREEQVEWDTLRGLRGSPIGEGAVHCWNLTRW
jgi:hypothetical protein